MYTELSEYEKRINVYGVIKKTFVDFGGIFSKGADKLADICIDATDAGIKFKRERLKLETAHLFGEMSGVLKKNLERISFKKFSRDTSYILGKSTRAMKESGANVVKFFSKQR